MSLTKLTDNLNIIQALPDKPTNTATELKQKFDEASNKIKTYINETLTGEIDTELGTINTSLGNKANTTDVNTSLSGKAPNNHTSSDTTYGIGTASEYGHCKVIQSTDASTATDGEALGAYQGYYLKRLINNKLSLSGGTLTGDLDIINAKLSMRGPIESSSSISAISMNADHISTDGGNINIGSDYSPSGNLYVNFGAIQNKHAYEYDTVTNAANMYITSNGWIRRTTNTSSKKYKTDIKELDEELNPNKLYNLDIKQFKYKNEYQPNENDKRYNKNLIGLIAEDVEKVYPIAVDYTEDGQVDNWNERYMIPAMLKLIQEQKKQIDNLEERISKMEV